MRTKRTIRACLFAICLITTTGSAACAAPARKSDATPTATLATPSTIPSQSNGYSYGSGPYYVAVRRVELGLPVGSNWGDAKTWYDNAQAAGFSVGDEPKKGAIAWTGEGAKGHVAIVEEINPDGTMVISEMKDRNRKTSRTVAATSFNKYIY